MEAGAWLQGSFVGQCIVLSVHSRRYEILRSSED